MTAATTPRIPPSRAAKPADVVPRSRGSLETLAAAVLAAGMFTAPFVGLKPFAPPPVVTWSYVLLAPGFTLLTPVLLRRRLWAPAPYLLGSLVLLCFSMISIAANDDVASSVSSVMRIVYATMLLPLGFLLWRPSIVRIRRLAWAYVLGSCFSFLWGLIQGPRSDGRYVGLATHPNGFGISLTLALCLMPFLAQQASRRVRLALIGLALFGLWGVWDSGSRAALLTLAIVMVIFALREQSVALLAACYCAAVALVVVAGPLIAAGGNNAFVRIFGDTSSGESDAQRRLLLDTALQEITRHPWLGAGFSQIRVSHNIYLQLAAAVGVIALLGFIVMLLAMISPVLTAAPTLRALTYPAIAFVVIGPITDTLTDTAIWAVLSLAMLATRAPEDPVEDRR